MDSLEKRFSEGTARVGVVGLGYAGLPMAVALAQAGFDVCGIDVARDKVATVNAGFSPVGTVTSEVVHTLVTAGRLQATVDFAEVGSLDAVVICVPTPLTERREPDLRAVVAATRAVSDHLQPGLLVALQSTSYPGTTRCVLLPELARAGRRVGEDFCLVFAPERIDPGNTAFGVENTPKLIGGITPRCTALGAALFGRVIREIVTVSTPEVAEMSKLVENTFRFINISFINDVAVLCDRLGISVWEVIQAAASKPFAFLPHYPGAGVGGHCIPVVPFYLEAVSRRHGLESGLVAAAAQINDAMPAFVVDKLERTLTEAEPPASGRRQVLVVGVTYKPDIADLRESAALRVLACLLDRGFEVTYHDPLIAEVQVGATVMRSQPLTTAARVDAVVLLTPHASIEYARMLNDAPLVLDTTHTLQPTPQTRARIVHL